MHRGKTANTQWWRSVAFLLFCTTWVAQLPGATLEARTALVIGVDSYSSPQLASAGRKDGADNAKTMADRLRTLGFEVSLLINPTLKEAESAAAGFARAIRSRGGLACFYFSGHDFSEGGHNYLIPSDAILTSRREFLTQAIDLKRLCQLMTDSGSRNNLVMIDARRWDKFQRTAKGAAGEEKGLPAGLKPDHTVIAYSASQEPEGNAATGSSAYTQSLVQHLGTPDLSFEETLQRVQSDLQSPGTPHRPSLQVNSSVTEPIVVRPTTLVPSGTRGLPPLSPPPSESTPASIDALLQRLEIGSLAFNTPDRMTTGDSAVLELLISPKMAKEQLAGLIKEPGQRETASLRISPYMIANLVGGPAFAITPISPEEQAVSADEPTRWRWNVAANSAGHHRLHLSVSAVLRVEEREKRRMLQTFDREVEIVVRPSETPAPKKTLGWVMISGLLTAAALGGCFFWWRRTNRKIPVRGIMPPPALAEVFVSYARRDLAQVTPLVNQLRDHGVKVWMDVESIEGASRWAGEIAEAIRSTRAVILMASRNAFSSEFVGREIALAVEEHKTIIPVYLEPAEMPGEMRLLLAGVQHISFHGPTSPDTFAAITRALQRCGVSLQLPNRS